MCLADFNTKQNQVGRSFHYENFSLKLSIEEVLYNCIAHRSAHLVSY